MNSRIIKSDDVWCAYEAALKQARNALCIGDHTAACKCRCCNIKLQYHPDLLIADNEKILKAHVEEIQAFVSERPAIADCRVVVIKYGGNMNDSAANALLKELEEGHNTFIICTDRSLLDTIRSRCSEIYVSAQYDGNDYRGLTYEQFVASTDMQLGVIQALDDTHYFPQLVKLCKVLENISNIELLNYFGEFKEKDKDEFFSVSTPEQFEATLKLLSAALCSVCTGKPIVQSDNLVDYYGKERCLHLALLSNEQIVKRREPSYSKADFFGFIKEFIQ